MDSGRIGAGAAALLVLALAVIMPQSRATAASRADLCPLEEWSADPSGCLAQCPFPDQPRACQDHRPPAPVPTARAESRSS